LSARLASPSDVAVDHDGNIYIADHYWVHVVRAATGAIETIAGRVGGFPTSGDGGPAMEARFDVVRALQFDAAGSLYFDDGERIHKLVENPHDHPLSGDMDGDGRADLVVWRPTTGTWYWLTSSSGYAHAAARSVQWGSAADGDVPLLGDLDGDGKADPAVWRASTGTWYWLGSSTGYAASSGRAVQWGSAALGDIPFFADIDGDHRADLVVWRASTGTWYWLTSSTGYAYAHAGSKQWGSTYANDVPLIGDLDGDGRADLVVWRPRLFEPAIWFWLTSGSGFTQMRVSLFGVVTDGDSPLLADFDGDGRADLATWSAVSGNWRWLASSANFQDTPGQAQWGTSALLDHPLLGDVDGDGKADPLVWRLSTGTWYWLARVSGQKQWGT
jgi:hypothetical protein